MRIRRVLLSSSLPHLLTSSPNSHSPYYCEKKISWECPRTMYTIVVRRRGGEEERRRGGEEERRRGGEEVRR
jgi:hypothetical protein